MGDDGEVAGSRSTLWWFAGFCAFGTAIGLALLCWGIATPSFSNGASAAEAFLAWCGSDQRADDAVGDRYYALFTHRYALIDGGMAIALASAATLALGMGLHVWQRDGEPWLRTPRSRATYILIGFGIIAIAYFAMMESLAVDLRRGLFPMCADSIGIPMMALTQLAMMLAVILPVIGFGITRGFGDLPVSLWLWDPDRPLRSWLVTILCGIGALLCVAPTASANSTTALITPGTVAALYLLLATRAALLAKKQEF